MDVKKLYPYMALEFVAMVALFAGTMMENTALLVGGIVFILIVAFAMSSAIMRGKLRPDNQKKGGHPYASQNQQALGYSAPGTGYAPHNPTPPPSTQHSAWGDGTSHTDTGPFHEGR